MTVKEEVGGEDLAAGRQVLFVTGTDTNVGKTVAAVALLRALARAGCRTAALKPVAAGGENSAAGFQNRDAQWLQQAATEVLPYGAVNPFLFSDPIAPHIAAENGRQRLDLADCLAACQSALTAAVDVVVVEGAGGWQVPLNDRHSMADLAVSMATGVVLVVGMKLGCLNHALLSVSAIERSGVPLVGWIANHLQHDMAMAEQNVQSLRQRIDAPLLGVLPYCDDVLSPRLAEALDLSPLSLAV